MNTEQIIEALANNDVTEELLETLRGMTFNEIWPIYQEAVAKSALLHNNDYDLFKFAKQGNIFRILAHAGFTNHVENATFNKVDEPPKYAEYCYGYYVDYVNKVIYLNPSIDRVKKDIKCNPGIDYLYSHLYVYGSMIIHGRECYIHHQHDVPILTLSQKVEGFKDILEFAKFYHYSCGVQRYYLHKDYPNFTRVYYEIDAKYGISAINSIISVENARKKSLGSGISEALNTDIFIDLKEYLPKDFYSIIDKYLAVSRVVEDIEVEQFLKVKDIILA